jgi:CDP-glycerol glycerophosphotransferase (TagB/SpsB family)
LGAAQFDAYFAPGTTWSREQFASYYQLDSSRPVIVLATLGAFLHLYDETYLVDWLLQEIANGGIPGKPQIVIRLHPASKLEYFQKYLSHPDVRISFIQGYIPSLGWTMTRDDVIAVANLLRHADLVISPGSTITIEAAIFDTPTIVPLFHVYQPELGKKQYDFHLRNHFKRLRELDLVPFADTPDELRSYVNRALTDKSWYRNQRTQLVHDYICFTDGRSAERLSDLILQLIGTS